MLPFLNGSDPSFPAEDAAYVVAYTASHGTDLRNHPATAQLRLMAKSAQQPSVKKVSVYALWIITGEHEAN